MKEGAVIRFLLVTLPAGLFLLGIAAMVGSHWKAGTVPVDPNEAIRLEAASLKRRPVSRDHLENSVAVLAAQIGERHLGKPEGLERAAVWIESTLGGGNVGYTVERHTFEAGGREVRNLVAELPGRERRDEIVVVGAHYDTVPGSPGANDNASGVAALLALARAMTGAPQSRTVRFVAFVNEEPPYFQTAEMGSRVYAQRCRSRGERIVAMLCLESLGCYSSDEGSQRIPEGLEDAGLPTRGDFLALVGDADSRYWVDSAKAAFGRAASLPTVGGVFPLSVPGVGWSDHRSFWQAGYPAVMVTDTAAFRDPHYHRPTDTPDRVDFARLEQATLGLEAVLRVWANP